MTSNAGLDTVEREPGDLLSARLSGQVPGEQAGAERDPSVVDDRGHITGLGYGTGDGVGIN